MESVRQATLKSAKWAAIEKFSVQGVRFLLGIIMARMLTPDDYGVISMITIFIIISETFVDSGFSLALVRQKDTDEKDFSTVFYFNLIIGIVFYALLYFTAPFIASFFKTDIITPVLRVISITVIINSLMSVYVAKMTIDLDFKAISLRTLLSSVLSGIIGVTLAYLDFGVWALVYQSIAASVINLVFIFFYCKWLPAPVFSKESFHRLFRFGRNILFVNIINRIYSNMTSIVIGRFFSSKALGYYDRGLSLAAFPVCNINGIFDKITLPILAKIQDDNLRLINVYRKYISLSSFVIFFGCCLLVSQAKPTIILLFTDKWADAIIYLQIYSFAVMFDHICSINLTLLQVKGRSDLFLRLELIKKSISIIILFASIPFGVIGICVSRVIYTQIAIFFNTYYTGKYFGIGYLKQFSDYMPYLIFAILSCIPSFFIAQAGLHNIVSIVLGTMTSIPIYWFFLRKSEGVKELKSLILRKKSFA